MVKQYALFGGVAIVAAIATAGLMMWMTSDGERTMTNVTIESVEDVAKLATINMYVSTYHYWTKPKEWFEWKNARLLVLASGCVQGRLNLEKATVDVSNDPLDRWVKVAFAPDAVEVSELEIGGGDIQCVDVANPNVLNKINSRDRNRAIAEAMKKLKTTAEEMGIVAKTKVEAEVVLQQFFASMGYRCDVSFLPRPGEAAPAAPSSLRIM